MHRRKGRLDGPQEVAVVVESQVGMDSALQAHLGDPRRLGNALDHGAHTPGVGFGMSLRSVESAEGTVGDADVGEVRIPIHHIGDHVPVQLTVQFRRRRNQLGRPGPIGADQRQAILDGEGQSEEGLRQQFRTKPRLRSPPARRRHAGPFSRPPLQHGTNPLTHPAPVYKRVVHRPAMPQFEPPLNASFGIHRRRLPGRVRIHQIPFGADPAQVINLRQQLAPEWIQIGRNLDGDVRGDPTPMRDQFLEVLEPKFLGNPLDLRTGVRNEVLKNDLLQMAVAGMNFRQGVERSKPRFPGFPQTNQNPAGVRDSRLTSGLQGPQPSRHGLLRRDRSVEGLIDVFQHQSH